MPESELGKFDDTSTRICGFETSCWAMVEGCIGATFSGERGPGEVGIVLCPELAGELASLTKSPEGGGCRPSSMLRFSGVESKGVSNAVGGELEEDESYSATRQAPCAV